MNSDKIKTTLMDLGFKPTEEQLKAVEESLKGQSFKVVAYAGSGKTSLLVMISHILKELQNKKGLYLAFNKSMAIEAKQKFNSEVHCSTFHALAYAEVPKYLSAKLANKRLFPKALAEMYSLSNEKMKYSSEYLNKVKACSSDKLKEIKRSGSKRFVSAQFKMQMINDAISIFCKSDDTEVKTSHFKKVDWLDKNDYDCLVKELHPVAIKHWKNLIEDNDLHISHDVYVKYWAMKDPQIEGFDYIMMDESQDMDKLMSRLLSKQKTPIIYVGDYFQQIYSWRGAVNTFKNLNMPEIRLTKSFRFGQEIANHSNLLLSLLGEEIPLVGNDAISSKVIVDHPVSMEVDAILCRSNKGAFIELVKHSQRFPNRKFAFLADVAEIKSWMASAQDLINNKQVYHSELSCFSSWAEVIEYCELNKADNEFKYMINLLETFNNDFKKIDDILNMINTNTNEADCVICTVHKAKGLEWDTVLIGNDFELDLMTDKFDGLTKNKERKSKELYLENWNAIDFPKQVKYFPIGSMIESRVERKARMNPKIEEQRYRITEMREEEIRVLYVALTRAKTKVYSSDLGELFILVNKLENNLD
jgi:superfamily I DNA/RNA helicase